MWTDKLAATGKGIFYAVTDRGISFVRTPTTTTDADIERWISKRIAEGETREDIEARLEARIADVASGYEDDRV